MEPESHLDRSGDMRRRIRHAAVQGLAPLRGLARRRRMWLRIGQGLAAAALLATVLLGVLMIRLSDSPLSVGFLTPRIAGAVQAQLPEGYRVAIEDTVIERDRDTLDLLLRLRNVAVTGPDGEAVFAAPRAAIGLSGLALAVGRVVPRSVWLIQPRLTLKQIDGRLRFQAGDGDQADRDAPPSRATATGPVVAPVEAFAVIFALLGAGPDARGSLTAFGVRRARLNVVDEAGASHDLDRVDLVMSRGGADGEITFRVSLGDDEGAPVLDGVAVRAADGRIDMRAGVRNLSVGDLGPLLPADRPFVMSGPIAADLDLTIGADGDLDRLSTEVRIGAGHVGVGGAQLLIDEADLAFDWSYNTGTIRIRESHLLAGDSGFAVSGQIAVPQRGDFSFGTVPLRLEFSDITIADPHDGHPSRYSSALLEAFYVPEQGFLHISRLDLVGDQTAGSFVGFVGGAGETPGIKLAGSLTDMPVATLKNVWPSFVTPKVRRWVIRNLVSGDIVDARLNVDIAPGEIASAIRGVPLPRHAFEIDFAGRDGTLRYFGGLPPMVGIAARGRLDGQIFDARLDGEARIDLPDGSSLTVPRARFTVPDIPAKPSTGQVDLVVSGAVGDVVRLLDHPPIELARGRGFNVDSFQGTGSFEVRIDIPLIDDLRFADIDLVVDGDIDDFGADEFGGARKVEDGDIDVSVVDGRILMRGTAVLDGVRAELAVDDPLVAGGEPGARSVTMTLDAAARARLGLPLEDILSGPIVATVNDVRATSAGTTQHIQADLTKAAITFAAIGIDKPAGERASAEFELAQDGSTVRLTGLKLVSDSLRVEGSAEFEKGGGLSRLSLPVLKTSRGTDLSVEGRTVSGTQTLSLRGQSVDLRNTLASVRESSAGGEDAGGSGAMRIDIDVDRAIGAAGVALRGFAATVARTGSRIDRLQISAATDSGVPVMLRFSDDGANSDLSVESDDAGHALAWTGLYPHMRGGRLRLTASRRGAGAPFAGTVDIDRFRIANDPSLARLIQSGERESRERVDSPPGPAQNQPSQPSLNVSDVGFDRLTANFRRSGPQIAVSDGVLRGVAVGATIEGSLDLGAKRLALHGTYVPLYALNNLFGQLPLFLGPLLGGKPNEGLLGITYSLSGTIDAPVLTINPISVVAPGVFRYILGMDNPRAASPRTYDGNAVGPQR